MHSLSNPGRFGLLHMTKRRGTVSASPNQNTLISGDLVQDANGTLWIFVGLSADRQPILAENVVTYRRKMLTMILDRMHA